MDNRDRLREAGMIADMPLPDRYYEVIDSLESHEIDVLIALRQRLVDAGIPTVPLTAPVPGGQVGIVPL
jgi:hypothetical protein